MLEAVNSVLSNASYTKVATEAQSVVNSYAANPERVQQATTQAPYLSLYIKVDVNFDKAVLQLRDIDTGDVLRQIPSETQLEAYRRAATSNAVRKPTAQEDQPVVAQVATPETTKPEVKASPAPEAPKTQDTSSPAPQPSSKTDISV